MTFSAPFSTAARAAHSPERAEPMIRMSHSFVSAMSVIGSGVSKNEAPDVFSVDAADLLSLAFGAHPVMPAAAATAAADARISSMVRTHI